MGALVKNSFISDSDHQIFRKIVLRCQSYLTGNVKFKSKLMNELGEKTGFPRPGPPFVMLAKEYDFGLSEKEMHMLNKVLFDAMLQYSKECATAEKKMVDTVQTYLKRINFLEH